MWLWGTTLRWLTVLGFLQALTALADSSSANGTSTIDCTGITPTSVIAPLPAVSLNDPNACDNICSQFYSGVQDNSHNWTGDTQTATAVGLSGTGVWSDADTCACQLPQNANNPRCVAHFQTGGQAVAQCGAYLASDDGVGWQNVVLAADVATTAICGSACGAAIASAGAASTLETSCNWSVTGENATELAGTIAVMTTAKDFWADLGVVASGAGVVGGVLGNMPNPPMGQVPDALNDASAAGGVVSSVGEVATNGLGTGHIARTESATGLIESGVQGAGTLAQLAVNHLLPGDANKVKNGRDNACINAMVYGVMTALREANLKAIKSTPESSCSAIKAGFSQAATVGQAFLEEENSGTFLISSALADALPPISGRPDASTRAISFLNSCQNLNSPGCQAGARILSSSLDTKILIGQNAFSSAAGFAIQNDLRPLFESTDISQSTANILGRVLGQGAGAMGNNLIAIMRATERHAPEILGRTGESFGTTKALAERPRMPSAPTLSTTTPPAAGDAGLTGMSVSRDIASSAPETFNDIWHSNSADNLFQIVSNRIAKSADRVEGLGSSN